ncbi:MAG: IclR family transcriptional regulator [Chloroflexi bacterium]|nr:IclR family transcriptional regulator [Chloroflexota bacterium]
MAQSPYQIESLLRGLHVLSLFNRETATLSLTEIKNAAGLNKTTVFRIVSTLESAGYLERDPQTKRYRPGLKVLQLGFTAISSLEFRQIARPYLIRLSQEVGRTVSLSVLDGMEVVYIDRVRVRQVFGVVLGLGSRIPSHCASLGKAMLAHLPPDNLANRLDTADLRAYTPHTLTDRVALEADLRQVRERGYAINDEEWVLGLRSTAAPILDNNGVTVGAINVSVSVSEVSRKELETRFSTAVRATAQEISHTLGYMPA